MNASLYVYYKTATPDVAVTARVAAMQAEIASACGVRGRLMRRRDDPCTWMEIYDGLDAFEPFERVLADAVARHRVEDLVRAGERRHAERFIGP